VQDVAIDVEWISEPLQEHIDDFRDHARIAAIRNNDDELIVAEPAYLGGPRKTIRDLDEALTDLDEQLIAGRMTQRVVDILEAVQTEQRNRYRAQGATHQQTPQLLLQGQAIGQPGQRIIMRQPAELLLRPLGVGNVLSADDSPPALISTPKSPIESCWPAGICVTSERSAASMCPDPDVPILIQSRENTLI
jgi:hypothetical protein